MEMLFTPTHKKNSQLIEITHTNWGLAPAGRGFTANTYHRYILGQGTKDELALLSDAPHLDTPADILELFKNVDSADNVVRSAYRVDSEGRHKFYAYLDTQNEPAQGQALESIEQSLGLFVISRFPESTGIYVASEYGIGRNFIARAAHPLAA